jgi:hypothetical protein
MFKVFAFLKRNSELLSHDEYRAGHIGFHCCNSRRLTGIRGYIVNVWANEGLVSKIGPEYRDIIINEPTGFNNLWDGFPQVYFDDAASWKKATTMEPTRATENGLSIDPDWTLSDSGFLFDPVDSSLKEFKSNHLKVDEEIIIPVYRPERKLTKIIQFFKKHDFMERLDFRDTILSNYAKELSSMEGLKGLTLNFRDHNIDSAINDFYPANGWHFSKQGNHERSQFASLWDGIFEMYFDNIDAFKVGRMTSTLNQTLTALDRKLFSSVWYIEVDESVIIVPNRDPAPDFYYR